MSFNKVSSIIHTRVACCVFFFTITTVNSRARSVIKSRESSTTRKIFNFFFFFNVWNFLIKLNFSNNFIICISPFNSLILWYVSLENSNVKIYRRSKTRRKSFAISKSNRLERNFGNSSYKSLLTLIDRRYVCTKAFLSYPFFFSQKALREKSKEKRNIEWKIEALIARLNSLCRMFSFFWSIHPIQNYLSSLSLAYRISKTQYIKKNVQ